MCTCHCSPLNRELVGVKFILVHKCNSKWRTLESKRERQQSLLIHIYVHIARQHSSGFGSHSINCCVVLQCFAKERRARLLLRRPFSNGSLASDASAYHPLNLIFYMPLLIIVLTLLAFCGGMSLYKSIKNWDLCIIHLL